MSISKNIGITYISQIVGVIISFLSTIYLARILGASGRGELTLYTNSVTFFNLFLGLSLPSTVIYVIANRRLDEQKLISTLILYTLFSTLFVIGSLQLFFYLNKQDFIFATDKQTFLWKCIFVLHYLSITSNALLIAFLNAKQKFMISSLFNILNMLIPLIGYVLIYYSLIKISVQHNYLMIVLLALASFSLTSGFMFMLMKRYYKKINLLLILNKKDILFVLRFSLIAWICNFVTTLTYRMDLWFVDHYHGKIETGVYSLAVSLSQFFWVLPNAIGSVLYSFISKDGVEQTMESIQRITKYTFYFNVLAALLTIIVLKPLIPFIYGEEFRSSYFLLLWLLPGVVSFSIPIVLASLYAGSGKIIINLYNTIFSFIICLILDIVLIKTLSATGAGIASSLSYIASTIFSIFAASMLFKIKIKDMFIIKKDDFLFLKSKFIK